MKLKFAMLVAVLGLGIIALNSPVHADEKGSAKGSMAEEKGSQKGSMADGQITAEVTETGAIKVGNTICPIGKKSVDSEGGVVEYEHEGKIYNFCCKACLKDFKKDPQKYVEIVDEMMSSEEAGEAKGSHMDHDHK